MWVDRCVASLPWRWSRRTKKANPFAAGAANRKKSRAVLILVYIKSQRDSRCAPLRITRAAARNGYYCRECGPAMNSKLQRSNSLCAHSHVTPSLICESLSLYASTYVVCVCDCDFITSKVLSLIG